jgi:hypothetical protein
MIYPKIRRIIELEIKNCFESFAISGSNRSVFLVKSIDNELFKNSKNQP